jgi:methyl-accepting chemotaxis protein
MDGDDYTWDRASHTIAQDLATADLRTADQKVADELADLRASFDRMVEMLTELQETAAQIEEDTGRC